MTASRFPCTALLVLLVSLVTSHSFALDDIKKVKVHFKKGTSSAVSTGLIKGYAIVDYLLAARKGQYMNVRMATDNNANYFNIMAPGEKGVGFFNGSTSGNLYEGTLPANGEYTIRVYQMRSAAHRNEVAHYSLEIIIANAKLSQQGAVAPAVSNDAKVAETVHHATGSIPCNTGKGQPDTLAGTSWQLVNIQSMDDTNYIPEAPDRYTLEFLNDYIVKIQADCNQGTGTWQTDKLGRLTFGDIAATKALCPPGSLHDRYLNQFKWVRHYLFKNGNLYLTTMADGSILQFAPATMAPLVATVLGRQVHTTDIREMQEAIISPLFRQYAQEHGIKAEESEIAAWVTNMDGAMRNDPALKASQIDDLTAQEKIEVAKMRHKMAGSLITQWKINRELYKKYGGRIIYQQLGPEPLDAYHRYLEIQQRDNVFTIHQPAMKSAFWSYFTDDSRHSFYRPGSEEEEQAFTLPPWEQLRSGKQ